MNSISIGLRLACLMWVSTFSMTGTAHAGPDDVTKQIMNGSASLLDLGLVRSELFLSKFDIPGYVYYDYEDDRIVFGTSGMPSSNRQESERVCVDWVSDIRTHAMIYDGEVFGGNTSSTLANLFVHNGYVLGTAADERELRNKIDQKIKMKCWVYDDGDFKKPIGLVEAQLVSSKYQMIENK